MFRVQRPSNSYFGGELIVRQPVHVKTRRINRTDGHQQDKQVDNHRDPQREKGRLGDVLGGLFHLLTDRGNQIVAFEGNKRQSHGHDDSAKTLRKQRMECCQCLRPLNQGYQAKVGKDCQYKDLGHGHHVLRFACHICSDEIQANKEGSDDQGDQGNSDLLPQCPHQRLVRCRPITG